MRRRSLWMVWAGLACLAVWPGAVAVAQQGHPLSGTWSGSWNAQSVNKEQVTLVLDWDGKAVTGQINPGPDAVNIKSLQFDPTTWTVRIEADGKDKAGKAEHISAEGRLENVLSYHRTISGTWHQGATTGEFRVSRD